MNEFLMDAAARIGAMSDAEFTAATDRLDSEFEERLNAVSDEIPVTEEEADALLRDAGINPDECLRRLVARMGAH
jgi:hypothetical protein